MAEPASGRAFGLTLHTHLPLPDLLPAGGEPGRATTVRAVDADDLDARFALGDGTRLLERTYTTGGLAIAIDHEAGLGYRVEAPGFGAGLVAADGRLIEIVPPAGERWRWQRLLLSQLLPTAAAVQGLDPLHAGGVAVDGGAVALLGASGMGKSSVGLHLVAGGAARLGDDLVVSEVVDGVVVSHSAAGVAYVDDGELEGLDDAARERVGRRIDSSDKVHLAFTPTVEPLPLRVVCSLERGDWPELAVEEMGQPEPMLLMASAFVRHVETELRSPRLLDLCHAAAGQCDWLRLRIPESHGAADAAAALLEHLQPGA